MKHLLDKIKEDIQIRLDKIDNRLSIAFFEDTTIDSFKNDGSSERNSGIDVKRRLLFCKVELSQLCIISYKEEEIKNFDTVGYKNQVRIPTIKNESKSNIAFTSICS